VRRAWQGPSARVESIPSLAEVRTLDSSLLDGTSKALCKRSGAGEPPANRSFDARSIRCDAEYDVRSSAISSAAYRRPVTVREVSHTRSMKLVASKWHRPAIIYAALRLRAATHCVRRPLFLMLTPRTANDVWFENFGGQWLSVREVWASVMPANELCRHDDTERPMEPRTQPVRMAARVVDCDQLFQ